MSGVAQRTARPSRALAQSSPSPRRSLSSASRRVGRDPNASTASSFFKLVRHYLNKSVVNPVANLADPGTGMPFAESPKSADDASLLLRSRASDDVMDDGDAHATRERGRARNADRGGNESGNAANGNSSDDDDASDGNASNKTIGGSHQITVPPRRYETSPFTVWLQMLARLVASALATAGLAATAALYPVYAITPTPVLNFLGKSVFNLGYLVYMSFLGRWLHLRTVKSHHESNQPPHSRGVRPSPFSTCSILPVPFLSDNYAYVLVDHNTRECAAIDPADPYAVRDLVERLDLSLTCILTTHKHHDHAGGNVVLQKKYKNALEIYGHEADKCSGVTRKVKAGDVLKVGDTEIGVIHVPCHTTGHVVYAVLGPSHGGDDGDAESSSIPTNRVEALFTGDAVINGGVGAFFHGTARDCYENLHVRLSRVPDSALLFSGHEYMQMNLRYASWLDIECEATASAAKQVIARRMRGLSTMPTSLAVERRVNPYFRVVDKRYCDRIERLSRTVERGKKQRWYARFFPGKSAREDALEAKGVESGYSEGKKSNGGGDLDEIELGGLSGGAGSNPATAAESVKCIETLQSLSQYRHLIEDLNPRETSRGFKADENDDPEEKTREQEERTSTGRRRAPPPGPVAL